jgi:hypothetical protein
MGQPEETENGTRRTDTSVFGKETHVDKRTGLLPKIRFTGSKQKKADTKICLLKGSLEPENVTEAGTSR